MLGVLCHPRRAMRPGGPFFPTCPFCNTPNFPCEEWSIYTGVYARFNWTRRQERAYESGVPLPPMHVSKSRIVDAFCHAGCASRAREYTLAICATERDLIVEMWWGRKLEWEKTDYDHERRHHLVCDW